MESILLPTCYFPPVSWFAYGSAYPKTIIEAYEHFPKQTWRNRCSVLSENVLQQLVVPLSGRRDKTLVKDIRIDHSSPWQKIHWKTLEACYRRSPWFEFYEDDIQPLFLIKEQFLFDLNDRIITCLSGLLGRELSLQRTNTYDEKGNFTDVRTHFSKKMIESHCIIPPYAGGSGRVTSHRNVSVLDLLFMEGKRSAEVLKEVSWIPGT